MGSHKEMAYIDCYEMAVVMFKCVPLIKLIKVNIVIISYSINIGCQASTRTRSVPYVVYQLAITGSDTGKDAILVLKLKS